MAIRTERISAQGNEGDVTAVSAGTAVSVASSAGPVPVVSVVVADSNIVVSGQVFS